MSIAGKYRVALVTLGCKLNFAESSSIAQQLIMEGLEEVSPHEVADLYIVNTCTVTDHSDKKCRNLIRRCHSRNKDAVIIVTGCYAELRKSEIVSIEGVSAVLGQSEKSHVVSTALKLLKIRYVENDKKPLDIFPAASFGERTRSFLKIQDGCDYFCTYCAIPFARGRSRAVSSELVLQMASELAEKGVKEIVLTGVNLGDYSRVSKDISLFALLQKLNEIEGIERYRISSIEPNLLSDNIIDWIAQGTKFQPHFHIPLQSGCDQTLRRMNRRYDTTFFKNKIEYIREKISDPFLGIDLIVGFNGETQQEFDTTYRFLSEEIRPAFLHIFPYSKREGTKACDLPLPIPENVKKERVGKLEELSDSLHLEYQSRYKGTKQKVLFESVVKKVGNQQFIEGYTGNYIRVSAPYNRDWIGQVVEFII